MLLYRTLERPVLLHASFPRPGCLLVLHQPTAPPIFRSSENLMMKMASTKRRLDEDVGERKKARFSIEHLLTSTAPTAASTPLDVVRVHLEGRELWMKFHDLGTEMIITKSGRRMFPTVKVSVSDADEGGLFYVFLDIVPVDAKRYRYIYNKSSWLTAGKAEPSPAPRLYMHPDSPFTAEQLQKQVISFEKAKLTNNDVEKTSHLILNSMHKYQPRVHVVRRDRGSPLESSSVSLDKENRRIFSFPETQFMAVTAYQNQLITKLKIEKNPFAKGFRDPNGREGDEERVDTVPPLYNPALLQHAFLSQYWLGKAPSLLSLFNSPLLLPPSDSPKSE